MPPGCAVPRLHFQKSTAVQGGDASSQRLCPGARLSPALPALLSAVLQFAAAHHAAGPQSWRERGWESLAAVDQSD